MGKRTNKKNKLLKESALKESISELSKESIPKSTLLESVVDQDELIDQDECKHEWVPAGSRNHKDRIHNKGNGKGTYKVYKCDLCQKFKRRYLK